METNKLTIIEIRYIRALAAVKTDEELAVMVEKPVELIKAQFALMAGLPKRPGERSAVSDASIPIVNDNSIKLPKTPNSQKIRKPIKKRISHAERKVIREQNEAKKKEEKAKNQSVHSQDMQRLKERKIKLEKSIYATRKLDLTDKVAVKLNDRTTVYVKPGYDIVELKKKYKIA